MFSSLVIELCLNNIFKVLFLINIFKGLILCISPEILQ
jgi:hypothetical protein